MTQGSANNEASAWLTQFEQALKSGDPAAATKLFGVECFWRDLLVFTWNIITLEGREEIEAMLARRRELVSLQGLALQGDAEMQDGVVTAWFEFSTQLARGKGLVRLRDGKCWTLLTAMTELIGFEERSGRRRLLGTEHRASKSRTNWLEERNRELADLEQKGDPVCLVIGGGQGGIALGARLRRLGVPTLIVEKNRRAGDSWRNRYRSLVLHDPVWYDHLPYLPFPDDWPVFTPKDKMGDWLEAYVKIMELNYWTETECVGASYDKDAGHWSVEVRRAGKTIILKPRFLVFATGAYGFPRRIEIEGADRFEGTILHTSDYENGEEYRGKKCVVIGSGSSAHDVSLDLWEHDADVTMVQRAPSIIIRSDTLMRLGFAELYSEEAVARGITTDRADYLFASLPFRLMPQMQRPLYEAISRDDADFYARLKKSGFQFDFGPDGSGLMMKALRTASGYYIDVGASELIANGEIRIASGSPIKCLRKDGMELEDGRFIEADVVIEATGYGSMDEMVALLISPELAEEIGPFWGYGSGVEGDPGPWEGELRNMWKPTAHEALWFHGGNLALSRFYSLIVALQIKARMEGIDMPVYRKADCVETRSEAYAL